MGHSEDGVFSFNQISENFVQKEYAYGQSCSKGETFESFSFPIAITHLGVGKGTEEQATAGSEKGAASDGQGFASRCLSSTELVG